MSTQHAMIVENRRSKVLEYHATNKTQREIASLLQCSATTVSKDIAYLKQEAEDNIKNHMTSLAHQYSKTCAALDVITKRAFEQAEDITTNVKDKIACLTLARDTIKIRYDLQTDSSILEEAMSYVEVNQEVKRMEDRQTNEDKDNSAQTFGQQVAHLNGQTNHTNAEDTGHLVTEQASEHSVIKQPTNQQLPNESNVIDNNVIDNDVSKEQDADTYEEQATNQPLPSESSTVPTVGKTETEPEAQAEAEIDKEIEAVDRRMAQAEAEAEAQAQADSNKIIL